MNPETIDKRIELTLQNYPPLAGRKATLLTVEDHSNPPTGGDWTSVTMLIELTTKEPQAWAETTYYGGIISHVRTPVPVGVRAIPEVFEGKKRITCEKASKQVPKTFDWTNASGYLSWPVHPQCKEPSYGFDDGQNHYLVGAYSGELHKLVTNHPLPLAAVTR